MSHLQSDVSVHGGYKLRKRANVGGLPAKGGQTVRNLGFDGSPPCMACETGQDQRGAIAEWRVRVSRPRSGGLNRNGERQ